MSLWSVFCALADAGGCLVVSVLYTSSSRSMKGVLLVFCAVADDKGVVVICVLYTSSS